MALPIVDNKDKRLGIIASILFMFLLGIYLFFMSFTFPDPLPEDLPLQADAIIDEMVLEKLQVEAGGAGGGNPSDDPVEEPKPEVQEVITAPNPEEQVDTGESNKTNSDSQSDNTATTTATGTNPFGGTGGGDGGGNGSTFGTDTGKEGNGGNGSGNGEGRVRYNEISVNNIYVTTEVVVKLLLTIDENGRVVAAQSLANGTTTTDQRIINQVKAAAKSQLNFNKSPGAGLEKQYYTVRITPH